ncbi:TPA: hypothetical protein I7D81_002185 [Vibrio cholerae]|nr:hypothetical protein [Vibrio cholerae]HAS5229102.1 hypothetical protein [Vibrio cholerae]HAS5236827.1 hypothetical protein [Vibrio cholerae]HAS5240533.1 hypothetical protein [Vibrio cholerae]HAS5297808.1 hypothetical protein [Vibrio cholerae]
MAKRIYNKQAKQAIVDSALKGRKLFWFGELSEKFLAHSIEEVIEHHREYIGDEDVNDTVEAGELGEIKMSAKNWFEIKCWNEETGQMEPSINAIYGEGFVQVSSGYL